MVPFNGFNHTSYVIFTWREHQRYCRTTLSIMTLGWISAIQCNWLRWSNWDRTADFTSPCVCSATKMPNIKHPYQLHPYEMSGDTPESNQLYFIIMQEINIHLPNCNLLKMYLKSKLQRCLYVYFYQSNEDLWKGSTQQGGTSRQLHCLTSDAWNCDQTAVTGTSCCRHN